MINKITRKQRKKLLKLINKQMMAAVELSRSVSSIQDLSGLAKYEFDDAYCELHNYINSITVEAN